VGVIVGIGVCVVVDGGMVCVGMVCWAATGTARARAAAPASIDLTGITSLLKSAPYAHGDVSARRTAFVPL
jgi:hypothetical protein